MSAVVHEDKLWAELKRFGVLLPADTDFRAALDARYGSFTSGAGAPAGTGTNGQQYYDTTNDRYYMSDGVGWVIMSEPTQSFASVITSGTGTITTVGAVAFLYTRHDGWLDWVADINITTNGTGASFVLATLPINTIATSAIHIGSGREHSLTGSALQVWSNTTHAIIHTYNNTYPGGSGARLIVSGKYLMASRYS